MPRHRTMEDARDLLFDAAQKLKNAKPEELDAEILRAKGIGELVEVIVDSARVEVQHARFTNQPTGSGFLAAAPSRRALPATVVEGEGQEEEGPRLVSEGGRR